MTVENPSPGRWTPPPPPAGGPQPAGAPAPPSWSADPGYQPVPPTTAVRTNGMAVAALVLGLAWVFWLGSILAVVFGHVALRQISASQGWQHGRGMALSGLILGYCGLALLLIGIISSAASG